MSWGLIFWSVLKDLFYLVRFGSSSSSCSLAFTVFGSPGLGLWYCPAFMVTDQEAVFLCVLMDMVVGVCKI